jgi:hypothetical protein
MHKDYIGFHAKALKVVAQNSTYTTPAGPSHHSATFDCRHDPVLKGATLPRKVCHALMERMGFSHKP